MSEMSCAMPTPSPIAEAALEDVKTIAVVGVSPNEDRPSHRVSKYMQEQGYTIIPIRPGLSELFGEKAYASLTDYGQAVDMVNIFRRPEAVPSIVEEAIAIGCKVVWMQEGICHTKSAIKAETAGMLVVQNKCVLKVHKANKNSKLLF
jgi:uncharacterized protein